MGSPERRSYVCGVIIVLSLGAAARVDPRSDIATFLLVVAPAAIAFLAAIPLLARVAPASRRRLLLIGLALALVARLTFLMGPPRLSDDVYRYVWEGRLQRFGYNPYRHPPDHPVVQSLHTDVTRRGDQRSVPTPYPPLALVFFRAVASVHESVLAFKIAVLLCDAVIVLALTNWLTRLGRPITAVLAYAWNPLVVIEGAGNAHVDLFGVMCLTLGVVALAARRSTLAALALGGAVATKFLPIVLAPLLWRRLRPRDVAIAAGALALTYILFLDEGRLAFGGLSAMLEGWRTNGPIFALVEPIVGIPAALGLALAAGFGVAWWARERALEPDTVWAWPLAITLAAAPFVYPWYLLWVTSFLASPSALPLRIWTISVLPTYVVWRSWGVGPATELPLWTVGVEFGAVGLGAAWLLWWRVRPALTDRPSPSSSRMEPSVGRDVDR